MRDRQSYIEYVADNVDIKCATVFHDCRNDRRNNLVVN